MTNEIKQGSKWFRWHDVETDDMFLEIIEVQRVSNTGEIVQGVVLVPKDIKGVARKTFADVFLTLYQPSLEEACQEAKAEALRYRESLLEDIKMVNGNLSRLDNIVDDGDDDQSDD